jgi:hypothetical protein
MSIKIPQEHALKDITSFSLSLSLGALKNQAEPSEISSNLLGFAAGTARPFRRHPDPNCRKKNAQKMKQKKRKDIKDLPHCSAFRIFD